jgi:hypothetical protein
MQMLAKTGIATTGEYPAFEDERINLPSTASLFAGEWKGKAIKVIDPHRCDLHLDGCRIIWLRRNERQQARSISKFGHMLAGVPEYTRTQLRRLERSLIEDGHKCKQLLRKHAKGPWMELNFDDLVTEPQKSVQRLAEFVGGDAEVMAAVIRNRKPECYPGLLEMELLREGL